MNASPPNALAATGPRDQRERPTPGAHAGNNDRGSFAGVRNELYVAGHHGKLPRQLDHVLGDGCTWARNLHLDLQSLGRTIQNGDVALERSSCTRDPTAGALRVAQSAVISRILSAPG